MVLELARPSEARCFPPAGDFFEAVLLQQPQATEAVDKGCFSRISDGFGTSSSFRGTVFSPRHCHRRHAEINRDCSDVIDWLAGSCIFFKHSPRFGLMIFATRKLHSV